jgi:hypothetical protein
LDSTFTEDRAMRRSIVITAMCLAAALPISSSAQRVDDLPRGAGVRLTTADGGRARGYIDSVTADAILLHVFEGAQAEASVRYRRDYVSSMEVMERHTAKGALRGGLIGLLVGGSGGFLIGSLTYSKEDCDILACSASESGALLGFLGAVVATPIGLLVGAAHGSPEWHDVSLRR